MENLVTKKSPPSEGSARNGKGNSPSANNKTLISRNLRLAYGEVASEPVPQKWLDLLEQLDAGEKK